jgi:hypothetical protein
MEAPKIGTAKGGYIYKGGDPASPESWVSMESPAFQQAFRPDPIVGFGDPGAKAPLAEGALAGFAGEIGGGLKAATDWLAAQAQGQDIPFGELYDINRAILEGQREQYAEQYPTLSTGLEVAGAIPTSLMMPGAKAASLPGMMKAGAGYGGLYGAGKAETLEDVPEEATKGLLLGAGTPLALKGLLGGAQMVGRGTVEAGKGITRAFSQADDTAAKPALKAVERAFKRDGMTLAQANTKLKELGPEGVLADVGGKNVTALAQNVAGLPGKSAQIAEQTLQTRMTGSASRLSTALNKALGAKSTAYKAGKDIIAQRNAQAGPLYTEAFEQSVDPTKMTALVAQLDDFAAQAQGTDIGRAIAKVSKSLTTGKGEAIKPKLTAQQLHLAKMDLDGKIGTASRAGNKPLVAELMRAKQGLLGVMDDIPQYQQARQIFSDDSAVLNAIDKGKQILKVDAEEMADMAQTMSKADWDGYVLGASKAITDKLKGVGQTGNAANRISTHLVRERIRNAFPNDEAFEQFMSQVGIEDTFAQLRNMAIRGSQTAERVGAGREYAIDAATDAMQGRFFGSILNTVTDFMSQFKQIPEATRDSIGDMLFADLSKNGVVSKKLMDKVIKEGVQREQMTALINDITAKLTAPTVAATMAE